MLCPGQVARLVGGLSPTPNCYGLDSWLGHVQETTDPSFSLTSMFFSSHPPPLPLSLKSVSMSSGED